MIIITFCFQKMLNYIASLVILNIVIIRAIIEDRALDTRDCMQLLNVPDKRM